MELVSDVRLFKMVISVLESLFTLLRKVAFSLYSKIEVTFTKINLCMTLRFHWGYIKSYV